MGYQIRTSNGRTIDVDTYAAAIQWCEAEWSEVEVGHDGDLTDGGTRTLVWECEADSVDDDGARAAASIVPVVSRAALRALRAAAGKVEDFKLVDLCDAAIDDGDAVALARCARAIDDAQGAEA